MVTIFRSRDPRVLNAKIMNDKDDDGRFENGKNINRGDVEVYIQSLKARNIKYEEVYLEPYQEKEFILEYGDKKGLSSVMRVEEIGDNGKGIKGFEIVAYAVRELVRVRDKTIKANPEKPKISLMLYVNDTPKAKDQNKRLIYADRQSKLKYSKVKTLKSKPIEKIKEEHMQR